MSEFDRRIFLVSHAQEGALGGISPEGEIQAHRAATELIARGIGQNALILSSTAPRVAQTAEIIAVETELDVIESQMFERIGLNPKLIPSIEGLLEHAAEQFRDQRIIEMSVVMVTHRQLIGEIFDEYYGSVEQGEVFEYSPGPNSWVNHGHKSSSWRMLKHENEQS